MTTFNFSEAPGYYKAETKSIMAWLNTTTVDQYAYSTDPNKPLAISKYISYDTLTPPNPFIAVTQDGRGNVVYDGGFPKFYNSEPNNQQTVFANMSSACKYLYNAIQWVKNTSKWNAGNRKILILGDCFNSSVHYSVKSTGADGFKLTLDAMMTAVGGTATYRNCSDYGSKLDARFAEIDQHALVIFFGCYSWGAGAIDPTITKECVDDLVRFREAGNGLILITDHGINIESIADAIANATADSSFFNRVNQVAVRFGAYFSGEYDRIPVNVGFLRSNYDDHPLYNGLSNADNMPAGASESKVVVTTSETFPASKTFTVNLGQGHTDVNIFAVLKNGSMQSTRESYYLDTVDTIGFSNYETTAAGTTNNNSGSAVTVDWTGLPIDLRITGNNGVYPVGSNVRPAQPWSGFIITATGIIGKITFTSSGIDWTYFNGSKQFNYRFDSYVSRSVPDVGWIIHTKTTELAIPFPNNAITQAAYAKYMMVSNHMQSKVPSMRGFWPRLKLVHAGNSKWVPPVTRAGLHKFVREMRGNTLVRHRGTFNAKVFTTPALCQNYLTNNVTMNPFAICTDGTYYFQINSNLVTSGNNKWHTVFGAPCTITDPVTGTWEVSATGVFTKTG